MNTLDLTTVLKNKDGEAATVKVPTTEKFEKDGQEFEKQVMDERPATLGYTLEYICLRQDGTNTEEGIIERYELFKKLYNVESVEVTDEELELLKRLVCEAYDIYFAGTILEILNK